MVSIQDIYWWAKQMKVRIKWRNLPPTQNRKITICEVPNMLGIKFESIQGTVKDNPNTHQLLPNLCLTSACSALSVHEFLAKSKMTVFSHFLYSPNLALLLKERTFNGITTSAAKLQDAGVKYQRVHFMTCFEWWQNRWAHCTKYTKRYKVQNL